MPPAAARGGADIVQTALTAGVPVGAVRALPAALIATIHGMTFALRPALGRRCGGPAAPGLAALAPVAVCVIFRRKEWV